MLRNNRGKSKVQLSNSTITEIHDDGMEDSASVLRQFHKEVREFEENYTRNSSIDPNDNNCGLSNPLYKDTSSNVGESFEMVASELGEAMAVISE